MRAHAATSFNRGGDPDLSQGSPTLTGRWNGRCYEMIRSLGAGANGRVYLVREKQQKYALKISSDPTGIALEYRLLQQLQAKVPQSSTQRVQGMRLGPLVFELDDCVTDDGTQAFFYTMEYIAGIPVDVYVRQKGVSAVRHIMKQILTFLHHLHELGYAFGDLKAENLLVDPVTGAVRLIDFGGATRFGEGIRQYTEWYDRAYWRSGSRRADRGYDLFAAAMLLVELLLPEAKKISGGRAGFASVRKQFLNSQKIRMWLPWLEQAWKGNFRLASQMILAMPRFPLSGDETGSRRAGGFFQKVGQELGREWDWSDWLAVGSVVVCMTMILRLIMVK